MPQSPARSSAKEDHPDVRQKMIANAGLPWRTEEAFDDEGESAGVVEIRDVNDVIVADVYWAQRAVLIVEAMNGLIDQDSQPRTRDAT